MGQIFIDGGEFLLIGIATKALRCAPHVDRSAGFRLNDRDHLSVDRRPCVPARHLVPPFSIVLARLFRRQYRHSEYGLFLIQTERTRDLVADRRQTAQILDDGADIELRQPGICAPWHDGCEDAAVRPNTKLRKP